MPFWSSQKIRDRIHEIVLDSDGGSIKQGSVELRLGAQAAISSAGPTEILRLANGDPLEIPPGQFALLLSEEIIHLPVDVLAFISLKTSIKSRGLINVSGFHVDPGFRGRLKFWVYNAGSQKVILRRGDEAFLIWFGDFNQSVTDPYPNKDPKGQMEITSANLTALQGKVCSPVALENEIKELEKKIEVDHKILQTKYDQLSGRVSVVIAFGISIVIGIIGVTVARNFADPKPTEFRIEVSELGGLSKTITNSAPRLIPAAPPSP